MLSPFDSTRPIARVLLGALVSVLAVPLAWAQLTIYHVPPGCHPRDGHLIVRASIVSADPDVSVRLYFRADEAAYYFVDMKLQDGTYVAVLPRPLEETRSVSYFIESWDHKNEVVRSREYRLRVAGGESSCEIDPSMVLADGSPAIIVHSTSDRAAPQPPGFASEGVAGYERGQELGPRKNDSKKIIVGALATGLSVGTVAVLRKSPSGEEPSSGTGGGTTPPPTTPPPPTGGPSPPPGPPTEPVIACFDAPSTALVGQQIRLDASCAEPREDISYEWDLGDGRARDGRVVSPVYWSAGDYTISLTVKRGSSQALVDRDQVTRRIDIVDAPSAPAPPPTSGGPAGSADLAIRVSGVLTWRIFTFGITYVMTVVNYGPAAATGVTVVDDLPPTVILNGVSGAFCTRTSPIRCDLGTLPAGSSKTITMDVTVASSVSVGDIIVNPVSVSGAEPDPRPATNRDESRVQIAFSLKAGDNGSALDTALTSSLEGFPQVVQGNVLFNQSSVQTINSTAPVRLPWRGAAGRTVIEGYLSSPAGGDGVWRFDFTGSEHFQAGSIEVRRGRVIQQDGSRVVFQIGAAAEERIEFTVKLNP